MRVYGNAGTVIAATTAIPTAGVGRRPLRDRRKRMDPEPFPVVGEGPLPQEVVKKSYVDEQSVIRDYRSDMRTREICDKYDIAPPLLYRILDRYGIQRRGAGFKGSQVDVDALVADYRSGMGSVQVREKYSIGMERLRKILRENDVPLRRRGAVEGNSHGAGSTKVELSCQVCGGTFWRIKSRASTSKYCSMDCSAQGRKASLPESKGCEVCGKTMQRRTGEQSSDWRRRKTCSHVCGGRRSLLTRVAREAKRHPQGGEEEEGRW